MSTPEGINPLLQFRSPCALASSEMERLIFLLLVRYIDFHAYLHCLSHLSKSFTHHSFLRSFIHSFKSFFLTVSILFNEVFIIFTLYRFSLRSISLSLTTPYRKKSHPPSSHNMLLRPSHLLLRWMLSLQHNLPNHQ